MDQNWFMTGPSCIASQCLFAKPIGNFIGDQSSPSETFNVLKKKSPGRLLFQFSLSLRPERELQLKHHTQKEACATTQGNYCQMTECITVKLDP